MIARVHHRQVEVAVAVEVPDSHGYRSLTGIVRRGGTEPAATCPQHDHHLMTPCVLTELVRRDQIEMAVAVEVADRQGFRTAVNVVGGKTVGAACGSRSSKNGTGHEHNEKR